MYNICRVVGGGLFVFSSFTAMAAPDLITNIESDKVVVKKDEAVNFTVTVENRGDAASSIDWQIEIGSASAISNTVCTATNGASCPTGFDPQTVSGIKGLTSTIPSMPEDSSLSLTFETQAKATTGEWKALSTVDVAGDEVPDTNDADINISIIPSLLSYGVQKNILRYENAGGSTITTPSSGDYVIYEVVVTNSGVDDAVNLTLTDTMGVEAGNATVPSTVGAGGSSRISGYEQDFYADGTTISEISCTASNGAVCPADISFTEQTLTHDLVIPLLPGRTHGAVSDPAGNPESSVTFEVKALIGQIACSSAAGHRTFVNKGEVSYNAESSSLGSPYGPGDSSDNLSEVSFNVDAPACPQYDIAVQLTQDATQGANGVDENSAYEYTVTVSNAAGSDTVTNLPFNFGLYIDDSYSQSNWVNFWALDSNITCTPNGGAVCPSSYNVTAQELNNTRIGLYSGYHDWPKADAVIPSLPASGSLTFTITGNAGEVDVCSPPNYSAYAYAVPVDQLGETNLEVPNREFTSYYNVPYYGWPMSRNSTGSFYGNNGYTLRTQWNSGITCGGASHDDSTVLTGPFDSASSTTPIAGPLSPGQLVYYRATINNLSPGVDFDQNLANTHGGRIELYINLAPGDSARPAWIDMEAESGIGLRMPDYYHPLDTVPGLYSAGDRHPDYPEITYDYPEYGLPWAALEDIGIQCLTATGGAQCPAPDMPVSMTPEAIWGDGITQDGKGQHRTAIAISENYYRYPRTSEYDLNVLHLPVGGSLEFLIPYQVPPSTVPCIAGGETYTYTDVWDHYASNSTAFASGFRDLYSERSFSNDESVLTFQIALPACTGEVEIDKRIVAPAAADVVPADGVIRYEVDLTYPASATTALDVARFTDIPEVVCGDNAGSSCADFEIINVVGCTVVSGNAVCPTITPIGQQQNQDGSQTAIATGTVDVRWGTPNATDLIGGAAFEPNSTIRLTLETQMMNATSQVEVLRNTATFGSDPDSSTFGPGLYTEDTALISVIEPDSMTIQKKVSPTKFAAGDTITYTVDVINNGPSDGQGAYVTDEMAANLHAANPLGFANIACQPIATSPPLQPGVVTADCANVQITNNGTAGFRIDLTGSWVRNSGYRFTFEAIAPADPDSIENMATLVPPPSSSTQRFGGIQGTTVNVRSEEAEEVDLSVSKTLNVVEASSGDTVIYTITISNLSTVDATGVVAMDQLPAGVTYVNHSTANGSYDPTTGQWDVGSVPQQSDVTLTIEVTVD